MDRATITDALRFWEIWRIPYNLVLIAVIVVTLSARIGLDAFTTLPLQLWGFFAFLAVVANVLYCAAYPVDLFVQMSDWRTSWRRGRIVLWLVGTLTAGWLAYNICIGSALK